MSIQTHIKFGKIYKNRFAKHFAVPIKIRDGYVFFKYLNLADDLSRYANIDSFLHVFKLIEGEYYGNQVWEDI